MSGYGNIQHHVVVIDDDSSMLRLIELVLMDDGHTVTPCATGTDGMANALAPGVDLVVLDLNLPDVDGIDVSRYVRACSNVPILMLTNRSDVSSRVDGLDAGADDYLAKPFNPDELKARVRSMLRRIEIDRAVLISGMDAPSVDGWCLRQEERAVVAPDGGKAQLTEREFLILAALIQRAGSIVTRDALQRQVAGREWSLTDRSLDVHISHIRKKLDQICEGRPPIRTVRGKGFSFQPQSATLPDSKY